jgi:PAS domain-containing protein
LGGAVPDKQEGLHGLATLFAEYGVDAFLESTSAFVTILDRDGKILSCNRSFETLMQSLPRADELRDFLSFPGRVLFDEFLRNTRAERTRKQVNLEFAWDNRWGDFSTLFIPLPGERMLVIAEPVQAISDLATITAELQRIKRSLAIKETELKAVIAQADEVSHTDALTLIPNRRQIIGDLQREVSISSRRSMTATVILPEMMY